MPDPFFDDRAPTEASPELERDLAFRGLRLTAPTGAVAGEEPAPVLAGGYHLDLRALGLGGRFERHIGLVVHRAGAPAHHVPAFEHHGDSDEEEPVGDPGEGSVIEYFNVDLAPHLGPAPATYFVYAFLGPYVSNVVRIDVASPEASS